jgi:hypothetical protein
VSRRSTLELLRLLRRRDRESRGRALVSAAREGASARGAADSTRAKRDAVLAEREKTIAAERARVDSGAVNAGALSRSHDWHRGTEKRLGALDGSVKRTAEDAEAASGREANAELGFLRATTAATRVDERVVREDGSVRRRDEGRDDADAADAWNARAADRRSRGRQ